MSNQRRQHKNSAAMFEAKPMRVGIYIRISTDEEHQPYSLNAQTDRLRAYVASQENWSEVDVYSDEITGTVTERRGLQRLLSDARNGRLDLLLVFKVDRLARTVGVLVDVLRQLDELGVAFRSATEPFDTTTPAGRLMVQMLGVIAEFERATIIDRVVAAMERKAVQGGWNGSAPFGFDYDKKEATLSINEDESVIVLRIFSLYTEELWGSTQIARWLNDSGIRTKRGALWNSNVVRLVLTNRAYLGETSFRGTAYPGRHAGFVDPAVFERAEKILRKRGEDQGSRRSLVSGFLLTGKLRCTRCGHKLVGTSATGNGGTYRYYTCLTRTKYGVSACSQDRLDADDLERDLIAHVVRHLQDSNFLAEAVEKMLSEWNADHPDRSVELAMTEKDLAKIRTTIERYLRAFEAGSMSEDACGKRLEELRVQAAQIEDQRIVLANSLQETAPPDVGAIDELSADLARELLRGDPSHIKEIFQAVIQEVKVKSRAFIQPIIRVPLVRIQVNRVGVKGVEPPTFCL